MEFVFGFDKALFFAINGMSGNPVLDEVMLFLSARWPWVTLILSIALVTVIKRMWSKLRIVLISVAIMGCCDALTSYGLKNNIERQRPCYALEGVNLVQPSCGSRFGFPSNHAANGAALAMSIHLLVRNRRISFAVAGLVAMVGLSRIYLGVHYPLDVLFGAFFGGLFAFLVLKVAVYLRPQFFKALQ